MADPCRFRGDSCSKKPPGRLTSLGALHFGVMFLTEGWRGAEGWQGCCLGQARLCTTSPSALTRCHCPGCGSQRLLRCRSHPAGRGPNSSSLFPPLAAVVAVAPCRRGLGSPRKVNGFARGSPTRGNGDDRRQRRKQGGAVGAAASGMRAAEKQTLGAATWPCRTK